MNIHCPFFFLELFAAVTKAVSAWRIVLAGRFRLLNQWCEFVEVKTCQDSYDSMLVSLSSRDIYYLEQMFFVNEDTG